MYTVVNYSLSKKIQRFKKNAEDLIGKKIIIFEPKYYFKKKENEEIILSILIELDDDILGDLYLKIDKLEGLKFIEMNYPSKYFNYHNILNILK